MKRAFFFRNVRLVKTKWSEQVPLNASNVNNGQTNARLWFELHKELSGNNGMQKWNPKGKKTERDLNVWNTKIDLIFN